MAYLACCNSYLLGLGKEIIMGYDKERMAQETVEINWTEACLIVNKRRGTNIHTEIETVLFYIDLPHGQFFTDDKLKKDIHKDYLTVLAWYSEDRGIFYVTPIILEPSE
jgi:hypothetical protein